MVVSVVVVVVVASVVVVVVVASVVVASVVVVTVVSSEEVVVSFASDALQPASIVRINAADVILMNVFYDIIYIRGVL